MTGSAPLRVLVVDDDSQIRRTLRGVLEDEGHQVAEAADGVQALEALEQRGFDAVLLDVNMPTMGGLEALVMIREQAPTTAVIMVSGESTISTAVKALKRGAFDFIEKPIDPEHLLDVLAQGRTSPRCAARIAAPPPTTWGSSVAVRRSSSSSPRCGAPRLRRSRC